ncbi:hypothetical protein C8T65DRAFT_667183 [Cerioporus squamosus]|nr:hypothetical protein C8T65DRAFT_667183 [Cerioporus squamosus]
MSGASELLSALSPNCHCRLALRLTLFLWPPPSIALVTLVKQDNIGCRDSITRDLAISLFVASPKFFAATLESRDYGKLNRSVFHPRPETTCCVQDYASRRWTLGYG